MKQFSLYNVVLISSYMNELINESHSSLALVTIKIILIFEN